MKASLEDIIRQDVPVLIDFYADWCQPCHMMTPILKEVKSMLGEEVRIVKIDVDKNPAVSQRFNIRSIPTMILFKNGELLWRHSGVVRSEQLAGIIREKTAA